jgi:hypothetical protein
MPGESALAADYRVPECLGLGETGTTFLSQSIRVGYRAVALKVVYPRYWADEDFGVGRGSPARASALAASGTPMSSRSTRPGGPRAACSRCDGARGEEEPR